MKLFSKKRAGYFLLLLVTLPVLGFTLLRYSTPKYEVGQEVDRLNGVVVYYNGNVGNIEGRNTTADGYNLGLKYQCVGFIKRYYYEHLHHKMPDSYGNAKDFFNEKLADGSRNTARNLTQYSNQSKTCPKVNDLLVLDRTAFNPYGHVAIIFKVTENQIEIVQQNPGPNAPSRVNYKLTFKDNKWKIEHERVLGWLRKE